MPRSTSAADAVNLDFVFDSEGKIINYALVGQVGQGLRLRFWKVGPKI